MAATRVEKTLGGNGLVKPYVARLNGELLRTKNGVARCFKTEAAAQKALDEAEAAEPRCANALNLFRTPIWNGNEWTRPLNRKFLRVCSVRRLLKQGVISKARAIELLAQRHAAKELQALRGAVEFWIAADIRNVGKLFVGSARTADERTAALHTNVARVA